MRFHSRSAITRLFAIAFGAPSMVMLTSGFVSTYATTADAAPVYNTFAYVDSFTPGAFLSKNNFGVGSIDETYVEGGRAGEYTVTGHARAYASTTNGQYSIGARAELDADYVPASLMQPSGSFSNTAETMAIGQIQDQLTFTAPGLMTGASMNVSFTYMLSGNGFTCAPFECATNYGPGEISATAVYGEAQSSIGAGFQLETKRIDFPAPGATFTHSFNVQNGSTENYTLQLTARVFSDSADAKALNMDIDPGYFNVHGDANYYSTLTIIGIAASDTNSDPIPGFTVTNSDGVVLATVPAPAAVWLFGSGLLGLIGVARRKAS
jgi:hypothetical protein